MGARFSCDAYSSAGLEDPKICKFEQVSSVFQSIEQNIGWFDISVDDLVLIDVLVIGHYNLIENDCRFPLIEPVNFLNQLC